MVGVLRLYQGGMGAGHLPDAGGILDQPSIMLDALNLMASFEAKLLDKDAQPLDENGLVDQGEIERRKAASWGVTL